MKKIIRYVFVMLVSVVGFYSANSYACFSDNCADNCGKDKTCKDYVIFCRCGEGKGKVSATEQANLNAFYGQPVELNFSDDGSEEYVVDSQGNIIEQVK